MTQKKLSYRKSLTEITFWPSQFHMYVTTNLFLLLKIFFILIFDSITFFKQKYSEHPFCKNYSRRAKVRYRWHLLVVQQLNFTFFKLQNFRISCFYFFTFLFVKLNTSASHVPFVEYVRMIFSRFQKHSNFAYCNSMEVLFLNKVFLEIWGFVIDIQISF